MYRVTTYLSRVSRLYRLSVNPGIEFKLLLNISAITGIGISIPVALLTGIPGNAVSALVVAQIRLSSKFIFKFNGFVTNTFVGADEKNPEGAPPTSHHTCIQQKP